MIPFLKQVADKYLGHNDISSICFVFPNRRSMAFFRKYLSENFALKVSEMKNESKVAKPFVSPEMLTINDLFLGSAQTDGADRVMLLLKLYDCYKSLNPKAESLDDFIFWGDVILSDFNDTDKYLADAKQLFTNITDYRKIQDSYSYLSDNQRNAIMNFLGHFRDLNGRLKVNPDSEKPNVKERFLQIWNILYPLYVNYNKVLADEGIAYEGMVYRRLAERLGSEPVTDIFYEVFPHSSKFVFVGLNALNECEKTLMRKMRDAGIAEFCWDYSGEIIRDKRNRSSFFMDENVREFPQSGKWDPDGVKIPEIRVISVPSSIGQVKMVPEIFTEIASTYSEGDLSKVGNLEKGGADCAVVLPDESLLIPLLNSIPPEIEDINVTMGYPMTGSSLYSLMADLSSVQMHITDRGGRAMFYHKQVWSVLSNSIFKKLADEKTSGIVDAVRQDAKYYIPESDLSGTWLLDLLFKRAVTELKSNDKAQIAAFAEYQLGVLGGIASRLRDDSDMAVELSFAKEYYRCVNMLRSMSLEIMPATYIRLLAQLLAGISVPFEGEPLRGLQIMGPLETRALDFRNLVIMSANEGSFPKRNVSSSFIPPELRKGFGLPTYEYQDAVWAYYFYRMITRAENVWMLYDSRTEKLKSGEESRYIKQLQYHFRLPLKRYVAKADIVKSDWTGTIPKTEQDIEKISSIRWSASSIKNYLVCPAKFYYSSVKGLKAEAEVAESLDYGMFGTVFHNTMWALYCGEEAMASLDNMDKLDAHSAKGDYTPMPRVTKSYIESWLVREEQIKSKVKSLMCNMLHTPEITGRDLVVADVIVRYVRKTLQCDKIQIEKSGRDYFEIYGLEFILNGKIGGYDFVGVADRVDSFADGTLRIVDYKTERNVSDENAGEITDEMSDGIINMIFGKDSKNIPAIALQMYIYDILMQSYRIAAGKEIKNSVYSLSRMFSGESEVPETVSVNSGFKKSVTERLKELIEEISSPETGFERTDDIARCGYCDFKTICGR